ncbi:glycosyltransferase [Acidianus manzaensis]|uniref:Glycogen synthase n=1 Tax=Acidianus manzaensis TaxID=282676 RepID=A0A1W6JXY0_9CREN|nr:glycosyltransferase [Acidianus manzaensis]ARM75054.1 glycogen synthase [Acidianus manzaensis]
MKRIESFWIPEKIDNVWLISFESLKIASMGGLGTAVYNLGKELAKIGLKTTLIMPSHGRHMSDYFRKMLNLKDSSLSIYGVRKGLNGIYYPYKLGFEVGELDGIRVMLAKGLDYDTGKIMDSWGIYDYAMEKSALLSRAIEGLIKNLNFNDIPSIIHVNDWHSVLAGVKAKLLFEQRRVIVPLMYTIHLLNKVGAPWHYASPDWGGLEDYYHYIWMVAKHLAYKTSELWDNCEGKIERFGCYEADLIASVSKNYLTYDVFSFIGNFMENKSCVTYNGTDWNIDEATDLSKKYFNTDNRVEARKKAFEIISKQKIIPEDFTTGNMIWNNRYRLGINEDWTTQQLSDGPLVLFTGRIVYQKGIDLLLRAFKDVVNEIWNAKLIILGIPAGDYGLLQDVIDRSAEIKDNVRLFVSYNIDRGLYKALHYVSSVFVIPSRWEPFGINAIEAMAVGTPVVAYSVGGLAESVLDLRWNKDGTGFLVEPESIGSLATTLKTAIYLSLADETKDRNYLNKTTIYKTDDVNLWSKVRQNAINRVNLNFRWDKIASSVINCYEKSLLMAKYRALAYM